MQSFCAIALENTKILYVNSYHRGYYWSDGITEGILDKFSEKPGYIVFVEYLDAKNDSSFHANQLYTQLFLQKYETHKIDIILVSDNDALDFILRIRNNTLFKEIKVVASGISNPEDYQNEPNLFIVKEITGFEETFRIMNLLFPNTDTLYFVNDRLKSGLIYEQEVSAIIKDKFPQMAVKFVDCFNLSTLPGIIASIKPPGAIFFSTVSVDCDGRTIDHMDVANILIDHSKVPLFSGYYTTITDGFIGGSLSLGYQMGVLSAEIALQLFEESEDCIQRVIYPELSYVFDYNNLKKFNIPLSLLPLGAEILNKPESIWQKNKRILIISGIIILQLFLVIGVLSRIILLQRRYKKEILRAMEKANESDRIKSIFLENVSHEIRTPLNSIVGFSDVLLEEIPESRTKQFVKIISDNAFMLNHIINHVFDFSLLASHNVEVVQAELNVYQLYQRVVNELLSDRNFRKKNVTVAIDFDQNSKDMMLVSDENKLYQVIKQLAENAYRFTEEGTVMLGVRTINDQLFPEGLKKFVKPAHLTFFVSDTGKGIEPEFQDVIFQPFRHVDERLTNANRGLGLGLSISKSIIEMLGGAIGFMSTPGKGSIFYFSLPFKNK